MPMIRVEMVPGRTVEQKRALAQELTEAFCRTCNGRPEAVQVVIIEVEEHDWATGGVLLADKQAAR